MFAFASRTAVISTKVPGVSPLRPETPVKLVELLTLAVKVWEFGLEIVKLPVNDGFVALVVTLWTSPLKSSNWA
jgi:hypothetical protein